MRTKKAVNKITAQISNANGKWVVGVQYPGSFLIQNQEFDTEEKAIKYANLCNKSNHKNKD